MTSHAARLAAIATLALAGLVLAVGLGVVVARSASQSVALGGADLNGGARLVTRTRVATTTTPAPARTTLTTPRRARTVAVATPRPPAPVVAPAPPVATPAVAARPVAPAAPRPAASDDGERADSGRSENDD
jgi:hypothetical protein